MSEQMTPMEGFNALAKDVLPKLIARIKELDSRFRDFQNDTQEDIALLRRQVQELREQCDKPVKTRTRKKKKEEPSNEEWDALQGKIYALYNEGKTAGEIAVELDAPIDLIQNLIGE